MKQNSGVKIIYTQFDRIVFLNQIRCIQITDEDEYVTTGGGVIYAEMSNGDIIVLAEYNEFSTCRHLIRSITAWASGEPLDDEDNVFVLWHEYDFIDKHSVDNTGKIQEQIEKYKTTY